MGFRHLRQLRSTPLLAVAGLLVGLCAAGTVAHAGCLKDALIASLARKSKLSLLFPSINLSECHYVVHDITLGYSVDIYQGSGTSPIAHMDVMHLKKIPLTYVTRSKVSPRYRGKGLGSLLYLVSARVAYEKGYGPLSSGIATSDKANTVWDRFVASGIAHVDRDRQGTHPVFNTDFVASPELKELEDTIAQRPRAPNEVSVIPNPAETPWHSALTLRRIEELQRWNGSSPEAKAHWMTSHSAEDRLNLALDFADGLESQKFGNQWESAYASEKMLVQDLNNHLETSERLRLLNLPRLNAGNATGALPMDSSLFNRIFHALLGVRIAETEEQIPGYADTAKGYAKWSTSYRGSGGGLNGDYTLDLGLADAQQSPLRYIEHYYQLAGLRSGETVCDLGASYAMPGFVTALYHPGVKYIGFEVSPKRIGEAARVRDSLGLTGMELRHQDLSLPNFELPDADVYYLFDPVNKKTLEGIMAKLRAKAKSGRAFRVIARDSGDGFITRVDGMSKGGLRKIITEQGAPVTHLTNRRGKIVSETTYPEGLAIYESVP